MRRESAKLKGTDLHTLNTYRMNNMTAALLVPTASQAAPEDFGQMMGMLYGFSVSQMIYCAAKYSFAEHLVNGPAFAENIAATEGLDPKATFRLMRSCAAFGLLSYDRQAGFSATPLLMTLRRDDPRSLRDVALILSGPGHWLPWGQLDEAVRTGQPQAQATLGQNLWDYYGQEKGALEGEYFTKAVAAVTRAASSEASRLIDTQTTSFAVDVGGASGTLMHALMAANPVLKGAVLDLPHVAREAAEAARELRLQKRLDVVEGDFLAAVPPADLYLLQRILCDWPDRECVVILENCRRAISENGRIVLIDAVLSDDSAPAPFIAQIDLTMMVVLGARERSVSEFDRLFEEAGFRRTRLLATNTPFSIIEAVPQ